MKSLLFLFSLFALGIMDLAVTPTAGSEDGVQTITCTNDGTCTYINDGSNCQMYQHVDGTWDDVNCDDEL